MRTPSNTISLFLSALCIAASNSTAPAVVLNEIMFDADGDENCDEFIELYVDGLYPMNLSGWRVSDGSDADTLMAVEQGLIATAGQYVLILDPDYFEDGSTTYDGMIPPTALVVTISGSTFGSRGLSNSTPETVSLIDANGQTVSSYTYTLGNRPGYSDEKIIPQGGDSVANWHDALAHNGTPGARNSVTPADHDLAVARMWADPAVPQMGDSFSVSVTARNVGRLEWSDTLSLFERLPGGENDSLILWSRWPTGMLAAGDSISWNVRLFQPQTAAREFVGRLTGHDDRDDNDEMSLLVNAAGSTASIVINEIMFDPEPGRAEWVELFNATPFSRNLYGWSFGDGTGIADTSRRLRLPEISLSSQGFAVLASDSSIFFENIPPLPIVVWNTSTITLNNSGDSLLLYDGSRQTIERVDYRPSWGSGHQGISLERISPSAASNDPSNWASSLDSSGSTLGRVNSRTLPQVPGSDNLLTLEPNPFSPDGDGHDDVLVVSYRLAQADSRLDLKVYDVRGREVRRLANNEAAGYSGQKVWDGKDGNGRALPTGLYVIYLEALGKGGTRVQTARRAVALARRS